MNEKEEKALWIEFAKTAIQSYEIPEDIRRLPGRRGAAPMTAPTTWFGDTPEDRRRTLGLVGMTVLLSPLIVVAEVLYALGVPCRRGA